MNIQVCSPYVTRNGRRVYASEYGLKAFCWFTTPEKQAEYLKRKAERDAKKVAEQQDEKKQDKQPKKSKRKKKSE